MTLETGTTAPTFTLPDATDGETHDLAATIQRGPTIVGIYKSSCEASKTMFDVLERLRQAYPDPRLTIWGVAQDSSNVTRSFIRRVGVTFPMLVDEEDYPVSRAFDIEATPTVFLLDSQGAVVWEATGFQKPEVENLSNKLAELLGADHVDITSDADDIPNWVPG